VNQLWTLDKLFTEVISRFRSGNTVTLRSIKTCKCEEYKIAFTGNYIAESSLKEQTETSALNFPYRYSTGSVLMWGHMENSWPLLWSSGQSSWLQIQRSGFDSRHYQIFREVVRLERCPLSLVSTIEEQLERRQEIRQYGRREFATLTTRHPSNRKICH
jgi:hypothetical protein